MAYWLHAYPVRGELPSDSDCAAYIKETSERIAEECRRLRATIPDAPGSEPS